MAIEILQKAQFAIGIRVLERLLMYQYDIDGMSANKKYSDTIANMDI